MSDKQMLALADAMLTRYRLFDEVVKGTGIKPNGDNWREIAFAIAEQYTPKMQVAKKRGRKAVRPDQIPDPDKRRLALGREIMLLSRVAVRFHEFEGNMSDAQKVIQACEDIGISESTFKRNKRQHTESFNRMKSDKQYAQSFQDLTLMSREQLIDLYQKQ